MEIAHSAIRLHSQTQHTRATVLHERFAPQHILFTGVAGGLAFGAEVGDVVVGTRYLQHDLSAAPQIRVWNGRQKA